MPFAFIPSIISAVVSAVSTIGPMVATLCTTVLPRILPILKKGVTIMNTVASIAEGIGLVHNLLRPGESVSDIGDRALQAGRGPETFDNFDAYMQSLRDLKLDPVKSQSFDPATRLVAGLGVVSGGLDYRLRVRTGTMANLWSLVAAPDYFTEQRLVSILKRTQEIANVIKYLDGTLMPADAMRIEAVLLEVEKDVDPLRGEQAHRATLSQACAAMRDSSR